MLIYRDQYYSLDELEKFNLNDVSTNDLHYLYKIVTDAFFHTSVKDAKNLKLRLGEFKTNIYRTLNNRALEKAMSQIDKNFSK